VVYIRISEQGFLLTLLNNGDLVGNRVDTAGHEHTEQAGKTGSDEYNINPHFLAPRFHHIDFKAFPLNLLLESEWEISTVCTHIQGIIGGLSVDCQTDNAGSQNRNGQMTKHG